MTIQTTANKAQGLGNGLTTNFNYSFIIPSLTQLVVQLTDNTVTPPTTVTLDPSTYSVSGISNPAGGSITYPLSGSPLLANQNITISRIVPLSQLSSIINQNGYYPAVIENALDYLTMITQQLQEAVSRAFTLAITDVSGASPILAKPIPGGVIAWDALGLNLVNAALTGSGVIAVPGAPSLVFYAGGNVFSAISIVAGAGIQVNFGSGVGGNPTILIPAGGITGSMLDANIVLPAGAVATTAVLTDSTTKVASTAFVQAVVANSQENLIYNPNFNIDQINEGVLTTVVAFNSWNAQDAWSGYAQGTGAFTMQRVADPDNALAKALKIQCSVINAAPAAADYNFIEHCIEGYDASSLQFGTITPSQVTVSFKFKSNVTGTYGVALSNNARNRSYVGSIVVTDVNEHVYSITLTGDATGAWLFDSSVGIRLSLCLTAGANFFLAVGAWGAVQAIASPAQVNFMANVANICYLKQVQMVAGPIIMPWAPRNYGKELTKAQRYYWKTFSQGQAVGGNSGTHLGSLNYRASNAGVVFAGAHVQYPNTMRTIPTITTYNPLAAGASWRNITLVADSGAPGAFLSVGDGACFISNPQVVGDAIGNEIAIHAAFNARLS